MSTEEEFKRRVRDSGTLIERLESCRKRIGNMCSEGRCPRMSIPLRWDDDDFFISTTLQDAIKVLEEKDGGC